MLCPHAERILCTRIGDVILMRELMNSTHFGEFNTFIATSPTSTEAVWVAERMPVSNTKRQQWRRLSYSPRLLEDATRTTYHLEVLLLKTRNEVVTQLLDGALVDLLHSIASQ